MRELMVDLLRHGQTEGRTCFRGETDDPLSELGWEQMRFACPARYAWEAIYTSPLMRCQEFARKLGQVSGVSPNVDAGLTATRYGLWEKRSADEIMRDDPAAWRAYGLDPYNFRPPGGESVVDVASRAGPTLLRIFSECDAGRMLLVTHSNVILTLIARAMGIPQSHWGAILVGYGSFTRIRFTQSQAGWHGVLLQHVATPRIPSAPEPGS